MQKRNEIMLSNGRIDMSFVDYNPVQAQALGELMNQEGIELESPQMEKESDSMQSSILAAANKKAVVATDTMPIVSLNKNQSGLKQNDTMENLFVADGDGTAK